MLQTGLDRLLAERLAILRGRRIGLVTHPAAVLANLTQAVDALHAAGVGLTTLFGSEHGLRGAAAEGVPISHTDEAGGLTIYSLYGETAEPNTRMLERVDLLLFDMQDVGTRYYTYLSTLFYVLHAAGRAGIPIMVLDRPNPLGGHLIEGPLVESRYKSFVGIAPLPIRHGLTLGEAACWLNTTHALGADLEVIRLAGWQRIHRFSQLGRTWVATSPGMAHLDAVALYPGTCLIEGTNMSVGRGTALPFEICGAPWLDGDRLARQLNTYDLPGVRFRGLCFIPTGNRYAGQECGGVQIHITQLEALKPVELGLELVAAAYIQHPDGFAWEAEHFDRLTGTNKIRVAIESRIAPHEIAVSWHSTEQQFRQDRAAFLLYPSDGQNP